jgi:hypothetical protein
MAKFKCMVSGTIVNFEHEHDIADMRKHPQYEEVVEVKLPEPVKVVKSVKE